MAQIWTCADCIERLEAGLRKVGAKVMEASLEVGTGSDGVEVVRRQSKAAEVCEIKV